MDDGFSSDGMDDSIFEACFAKSANETLKDLEERILTNEKMFADIERRKATLNSIVSELKEAVLLRKEMDKCASLRMTNGIDIWLKGIFVYPMKQIVTINVHNKSKFKLRQWVLSVNFSKLYEEEDVNIIRSESIPLPNLCENAMFRAVLTLDASVNAKFLTTFTLLKVFNIDCTDGIQSRTLRIDAGCAPFTSWECFSPTHLIFPSDSYDCDQENRQMQKGPTIRQIHSINPSDESECVLTTKMLFLLSGGKYNRPLDAIALITSLDSVNVISENDSHAKFYTFLPFLDETTKQFCCQAEVLIQKCENSNLRIRVKSATEGIARQLIHELCESILIKFSRIIRTPVDKPSGPLCFSSIDELWQSFTRNYS